MSKYKVGDQVYVDFGSVNMWWRQVISVLLPKHRWQRTKYIVASDRNDKNGFLVSENSVTIKFYRKDIGYMMATTAFHLTGELSKEEPSLCHIYGETRDDEYGYYVGMWELGYGYFDVLFPKESTRPLTDEEVSIWSGKQVQIGHQLPHGYNADDLRASREKIKKHLDGLGGGNHE